MLLNLAFHMCPCTLKMHSTSELNKRCCDVTDYSVDFSQRPKIQNIIGERAEFLVHTFCVMDLASLDATMSHPSGQHCVMARQQHGGEKIPLTDQQYTDLITVQLADWLEQVGV